MLILSFKKYALVFFSVSVHSCKRKWCLEVETIKLSVDVDYSLPKPSLLSLGRRLTQSVLCQR